MKNYKDTQTSAYWCKTSFESVDREDAELVKHLDTLLPEKYCIIRVDNLPNIDQVNEYYNRATIAESQCKHLQQELEALNAWKHIYMKHKHGTNYEKKMIEDRFWYLSEEHLQQERQDDVEEILEDN